MSTLATRLKLLCVDDEPHILEGLSLHLRRRYTVITAGSGALGLQALRADSGAAAGTAIVISDMRMPAMDGATFLSQARRIAPDAVRILLTGESDLDSAIAAINQGQIFRFLTKPCPPSALLNTVDDAATQHRLITAERVLLEQTLRGSIQALTDVLALTNPVLFGRAMRVKQHVTDLATHLEIPDRWQVEVAAMLCQLGGVALPTEALERMRFGQPLSEDEEKMVARLPALTEQLLANIPRLDVVRGVLAAYSRPPLRLDSGPCDAQPDIIERGAQLLRVAADFDILEAQGHSPARALNLLRARLGCYAADVLEALEAVRGVEVESEDVREVPLSTLKVGMVLAEDVKTDSGILLVARGYQVTAGFVERALNLRGSLKRSVRVIVTS
jgi:response regulator RpfG family c-di-GMP phosphodiesterase